MSTPDNQQLPLFELEPSVPVPIMYASVEKSYGVTTPQESPYSKYIIYVDESGDHSLQTIDA